MLLDFPIRVFDLFRTCECNCKHLSFSNVHMIHAMAYERLTGKVIEKWVESSFAITAYSFGQKKLSCKLFLGAKQNNPKKKLL